MKVAIACTLGKVAEHFGYCEKFVIYEIEAGKIKSKEEVKNPGHVPGYLPKFLKEKGVDIVIAGGIGPRAINLLNSFNIKVISRVSGNEKEVIENFLKGELKEMSRSCKE